MVFKFDKTKITGELKKLPDSKYLVFKFENKVLVDLRNEIHELNQQLAFYKMPTEYSSILEELKETKEKLYLDYFLKHQSKYKLGTSIYSEED